MDYAGNPKKNKEENKPAKVVEKVVATEVIVQKKTLGRKFRDLFLEADLKSVARYVVSDVLLPALRNTIVDASTKGIERMMYGDSATRRRGYGPGGRVTYTSYQSPVSRGPAGSSIISRMAPSIERGPRTNRYSRDDFILASRDEADLVLERMNDILEQYEVVSVADLHDLIGYPTTHVENKWGWTYLGDVQVRQVREGYLIDFPPAEPIG